jgi:hypothetical protein
MSVSLDSLYEEAVGLTRGVAELDKKFGVKREDYKSVHKNSVETVVYLASKEGELKELAKQLASRKLI